MSYIIKKIGETYNTPTYFFECDNTSDVKQISTNMVPMGSRCHVINEAQEYVLDSAGQWCPVLKGEPGPKGDKGDPGASSWNDLQDKPFGEEQAFEPIMWDGSFDEANTFAIGDILYARISDAILTPEQIHGAEAVCLDRTWRVTSCESAYGVYTCDVSDGRESMNTVIIVVEDKDVASAEAGFAIPSNGVYSLADPENGTYVLSITKATIKTLDEKYMPMLTSPSGKKFKLTVDDNGVISATELT